MIRRFFYSVVLFLAVFLPLRGAGATVIDFEGLPDSTAVTTQYNGLGVTFTGATVLTSGITLDEFEFPPHSGTEVVYDDGGPITLDFSSPISSVGGYFTYNFPLTLTAYDASHSVVATVSSPFDNNMALSGEPGSLPNEFLQVAFGGGIATLVIAGDPAGSSLALDDLTIGARVPEPGTSLLVALGLASLAGLRGRRRAGKGGNHA